MKDLKEYIVEKIFDTNEDTIDKNIKDQIKQFLKDNFKGVSLCKISDKPNADGKYEVSSNKDIIVENKKITSLTNGMFIWAIVGGDFGCVGCNLLTSLKGAPKEVGGDFICGWCDSLESLEGAPKEVGGDFGCYYCTSLKSLKGAPTKVKGDFMCPRCSSLTSLEGAPKEIGGDFECGKNGFTTDDIKKVSNVKGMIRV